MADLFEFSTLFGWWLAREHVDPRARELAGFPLDGLRRAVNWLKGRVARGAQVLDRLRGLAEDRGFTVARVFRTSVVEKIKTSLAVSLKKGDNLEEWRNGSLRRIAGTSGIGNAHAETIYRNAFQSARQAAMREEFRAPDLSRWIVAYEYLTMDDDRVREEHAAMHGVVFDADDPRLQLWWPPNGHNCRCMVLPIDRLQAQSASFRITENVPSVRPDDGWEGPPEEL